MYLVFCVKITVYFTFKFVHEKNSLAEIFKNLARCKNLKVISLDYQNNYVRHPKYYNIITLQYCSSR